MLCALLHVALAQPPATAPSMLFDLPAAPLRDTLERYDAQARLPVFYPSELVDGRISSPVHGRHLAEDALRRLLTGTGLDVRRVTADSFVLEARSASASVATPPADDGRLQHTVQRGLCAAGLTPGDFRLALRVQVDGRGRISDLRLLDTTGDTARDARVQRALQGLDLGAPPADPTRPFVVLVERRASASCATRTPAPPP